MTKQSELELAALAAGQALVMNHASPDVRRFAENLTAWGTEHVEVSGARLPVAETFLGAETQDSQTRVLLRAFQALSAGARWEQSYKRTDGLVGEDMLAGYGFIELVGKLGPFVSDKIRLGVGAWGPHIKYPAHHHAAEEMYLLLAGSAWFELEGEAPVRRGPGDVVYVCPSRVHGLHTREDPVVVFYLWQGGELREQSKFGATA